MFLTMGWPTANLYQWVGFYASYSHAMYHGHGVTRILLAVAFIHTLFTHLMAWQLEWIVCGHVVLFIKC